MKGAYRQTLQYTLSDAPGPNRADDLVLDVVSTASRAQCSGFRVLGVWV